jgi:hypothetical protein
MNSPLTPVYPSSPDRMSSYSGSCFTPPRSYSYQEPTMEGLQRFAEFIHEHASEVFLDKTFVNGILDGLHKKVRDEQYAEWSFNPILNIFEPVHPEMRSLRPREFCLTTMSAIPELDATKLGKAEITAIHGLGFEVIQGWCGYARNPSVPQWMIRLRAVPLKGISEIPEWFILQAERIHQEAIQSSSPKPMTAEEADVAMILSQRMSSSFLA